MRAYQIKPVHSLRGKITLPADKSIAHRAIIVSSLSEGLTRIKNFPSSRDSFATINAFRQLGIKIRIKNKKEVIVFGKGLLGFKKPKSPIFMAESGTTMRLLAGILCGQNFISSLTAGPSLSQRPMKRITHPLRLMGANIFGVVENKEEYPPLIIRPAILKVIDYKLKIPSAQIKSCLLLAGLYAKGKTRICEIIKSRDHTERMLKLFKAPLEIKNLSVSIKGKPRLRSPGKIEIPGDISSASFLIVGATILPDSELLIKSVGLNPTRLGLINVLRRMKAEIKIIYKNKNNYEPQGDILVKGASLKAAVIKKEEVPTLIDELPILMVAAALSKGKTIINGIEELHHKETDRIKSMLVNLRKMGVDIKVKKRPREALIIEGRENLIANKSLNSFGDHRTAMSLIIAGLRSSGFSKIDDVDCIKKSFPEFIKILESVVVR